MTTALSNILYLGKNVNIPSLQYTKPDPMPKVFGEVPLPRNETIGNQIGWLKDATLALLKHSSPSCEISSDFEAKCEELANFASKRQRDNN